MQTTRAVARATLPITEPAVAPGERHLLLPTAGENVTSFLFTLLDIYSVTFENPRKVINSHVNASGAKIAPCAGLFIPDMKAPLLGLYTSGNGIFVAFELAYLRTCEIIESRTFASVVEEAANSIQSSLEYHELMRCLKHHHIRHT